MRPRPDFGMGTCFISQMVWCSSNPDMLFKEFHDYIMLHPNFKIWDFPKCQTPATNVMEIGVCGERGKVKLNY
jgi:hypothetical protein